jgi:hypothetical protein
MDTLLYTDSTHKDIWFKLVLAIPVVIILVPALCYLNTNENEAAFGMFGTVVFILVIFWIIFPRQYVVFGSKVRIVFGGPFSFTIPFATIKMARIAKGTSFGMNLPSSLSNKHAVEIVRNKRMSVIITPANRELFLETLDKALSDWRKYNSRGTQ